jgi:protein-S-isoprenylcysteine O-methyltransferase Ste14
MFRARKGAAPEISENWKDFKGRQAKVRITAPPQPANTYDPKKRLMEVALNLVGSCFYIFSAAALIIDYRMSERFSSLLMLILTAMFAFFFIARTTPPRQGNSSPRDWFVAVAGTAMPLLLRPAGAVHDLVLTEGVQLLGLCISIAGLLALNNSFGMVAANRGVKSNGIYRYIRHPIYAGYLVAASGFLVQNFTLPNVAVMTAWFCLEVCRMQAEERLLSRDSAYADYMKNTKWRIIPYIF